MTNDQLPNDQFVRNQDLSDYSDYPDYFYYELIVAIRLIRRILVPDNIINLLICQFIFLFNNWSLVIG